MAIDIIRERASVLFPDLPLRCDLIGVSSAFGSNEGITISNTHHTVSNDQDVRVRVATFSDQKNLVAALCADVEALYTNGPAGGGGVRMHITPRITTASVLIPESVISTKVNIFNNGISVLSNNSTKVGLMDA
jgi:hypothetical protein